MSTTAKKALFWTPRVLCILFALFLSMFALDVFGEGYSVWDTILALLIHLIPVYMVLAALALAWRWEWTGAVLFTGLGIFYIVMAWGRFPLATYVLIAGPAFVLAALFLANWMYRKELRTA
jgi:hypothetical protein